MTTKKNTDKQSTTSCNIYQKLHKVQAEIKELIRTEENKFQKYWFFNELQILQLLKPLLDKYQLTILLSDDTSRPFLHEREGKEHFVKYLKQMQIIDCEQPTQQLTFSFWAGGQNTDLAKAKGSAETYAIKYLLSKFFLMPVKDEADPDYGKPKEEKQGVYSELYLKDQVPITKKPTNSLFSEPPVVNSVSSELVQQLINLFRQKTADQKKRQDDFLTKLDQLLAKQGLSGKTETNANSFQSRLALLTPLNYQELYNWLLRLENDE